MSNQGLKIGIAVLIIALAIVSVILLIKCQRCHKDKYVRSKGLKLGQNPHPPLCTSIWDNKPTGVATQLTTDPRTSSPQGACPWGGTCGLNDGPGTGSSVNNRAVIVCLFGTALPHGKSVNTPFNKWWGAWHDCHTWGATTCGEKGAFGQCWLIYCKGYCGAKGYINVTKYGTNALTTITVDYSLNNDTFSVDVTPKAGEQPKVLYYTAPNGDSTNWVGVAYGNCD